MAETPQSDPRDPPTDKQAAPHEHSTDRRHRRTDRFPVPGKWFGVGIEFMGVMGVFTYAGWKLDEYLRHGFPWVMIVAMVLALVGMTWNLYKELIADDNHSP